ncbi:unnamed protein product [Colias eurytheme]|nr:unnamed protein product [Colias eurytheme]
MNGRKQLLHKGYTFYIQRKSAAKARWLCTCYAKCKAFLYVDKHMHIMKTGNIHNHDPPILIKLQSGLYQKAITARCNSSLPVRGLANIFPDSGLDLSMFQPQAIYKEEVP